MKWAVGVGNWKKKRGWDGGKRSHGMSKKVRGSEVGGAEPGGGATLQRSSTLTAIGGAMAHGAPRSLRERKIRWRNDPVSVGRNVSLPTAL